MKLDNYKVIRLRERAFSLELGIVSLIKKQILFEPRIQRLLSIGVCQKIKKRLINIPYLLSFSFLIIFCNCMSYFISNSLKFLYSSPSPSSSFLPYDSNNDEMKTHARQTIKEVANLIDLVAQNNWRALSQAKKVINTGKTIHNLHPLNALEAFTLEFASLKSLFPQKNPGTLINFIIKQFRSDLETSLEKCHANLPLEQFVNEIKSPEGLATLQQYANNHQWSEFINYFYSLTENLYMEKTQ